MPWTTTSGTLAAASVTAVSSAALSTRMLWPWLARTSQPAASVAPSSSDGLVAGLGFIEKRCLSLLATSALMSASDGAIVRSGPHCSWRHGRVSTRVLSSLPGLPGGGRREGTGKAGGHDDPEGRGDKGKEDGKHSRSAQNGEKGKEDGREG